MATSDLKCLTSVFIAVRSCLGFVVVWALFQYRNAVRERFGRGVARWLLIITVTQFHFMFYMSRPLPNTYALAIGTVQ